MKLKYHHLLNKKFTRRITKSNYPNVFLYFIEFSDPDDIKYKAIASETNIPVHTIRSLSRPAKNNETIADGLVDLGVREVDIPEWFAISKNLRRMINEVKKRPQKVRARKIPHIQEESTSEYPRITYFNLPNLVRTPEEIEADSLRKWIQAEVAADNREKMEVLNIISWKIHQAREEQEREKQKERDVENVLAKIRAKTIWNVLMRNFMFNQMMTTWIMSQPLHPENSRARAMKELFDVIEKLFDVVINFIKDLNKRKPISNVGLELELLEPEDWSDLNDQMKEILENMPSLVENIKTALDLRDGHLERTRIRKLAMHGNLLQPQEIHWPPGFKPISLLDGDRGKRISKLMNLDHLRPNGARDSKKHTE